MQDIKHFSVQLTRKSAIGWFCFFLLVCAWMFVLGIIVGRGTAPVHFNIDKLQNDLAALKEALIKKEQEKNKDLTSTLTKEPDLDFHENLKTAKSPPPLPKLSYTPEVKKEPVPEAKTETLPEAPNKEVPNTNEAVSGPSPATTPSADVNKEESPETPSGKSYTIQVAAFKKQNDAEAFASTLKEKGYPSYTVSGKTADGTIYYRVRVGSFKDRNEASAVVSALLKDKQQAIILEK